MVVVVLRCFKLLPPAAPALDLGADNLLGDRVPLPTDVELAGAGCTRTNEKKSSLSQLHQFTHKIYTKIGMTLFCVSYYALGTPLTSMGGGAPFAVCVIKVKFFSPNIFAPICNHI